MPQGAPRYQEPLDRYVFDGYHPTHLGDMFNDRYKVTRKLGWGRYSTVWLAEDRRSQGYVALKVLTGEASKPGITEELESLQRVRDGDQKHPGYSHVLQLYDHFYHKGPHGSHLCLVTEVLGPSLAIYAHFFPYKRIPVPSVKRVVRQLLHGLAYVHACGIIHTDLQRDNFLVVLDDVKSLIKAEQHRAPPVVHPPIVVGGGVIVTYVSSQPLPFIYANPNNDGIPPHLKVKVADLGASCWAGNTAKHSAIQIQPTALRAPEVVIGADWDWRCDMWNLGCIVYEMIYGDSLFDPKINPYSHVASMIATLGDFPQDFIAMGRHSSRFFKPDGSFFVADIPRSSLAEIVNRRRSWMHADEEARFVDFLGSMLTLRPSERMPAGELAKHAWL